MIKRIAIVILLLSAIVLHADIFDRLFSTSKKQSIAQAEVTLYSLHAIQNKYLNKSKLNAEDLLQQALDYIQEDFSEIVIEYDKKKMLINLQIYNEKHNIHVKRLKDLWDIAIILRQIYGYVEKDYKPEGDQKITDVEYVAVNGILRKLDPHSYIFTPREYEDFTSNTEGNFGGLGIVISSNEDGEIVVVSPIEGTPAMKAGVETGDVIVQINDESAINMPLSKAVERMRGKPGTDIVIYVKRKEVPSVLRFKLTRDIIKIQSVVAHMPQKGIGYIKLTGFMENSYSQLKSSLKKLRRKGMKALVLDMRNNAGGLLSQAIKISDLFLKEGVIVSTVSGNQKDSSEATAQRSDILDIPIAVIVNEGSASATEIVTAALKKNNRAFITGRKTFGKGSVQNLFRIPGGGGLKLTIAQYLTPGDVSIQSVGITPDIEYIPTFIDKQKISIFKNKSDVIKEEDLKEHIISRYIPKKLDKPSVTIYYNKPYKDPQKLLKERRKEKMYSFKNDEEIELTVELLKSKLRKKKKATVLAKQLKKKEWAKIVKRLNNIGITWSKHVSMKEIDPSKLNIELISSHTIKGGDLTTLKFKATYPGKIENLMGALNTKIPYLRNLEIPFGTFENSVERDVPVKLPEFMPWRKENVQIDLALNSFDKIIKKSFITMETVPKKEPEVKMTYLIDEISGNKNGVLENNEHAIIRIWLKNAGKGGLDDGRLLLINANNNKRVFIEKGSAQLKLAPGEEKKIDLKLKISEAEISSKNNQKEKLPVKIAISLYDYKTRYTAGFSIPFNNGNPTCSFEKKKSKKGMMKNAELYRSSLAKNVVGISNAARVDVVGMCGGMSKLSNGYWVKNSSFSTKKHADKLSAVKKYDIFMPRISMDEQPVITDSSTYNFPFKVEGKQVQDVFLYHNNKKIFYYRAVGNDSKNEFSVPLKFEKKTNKLTVVVKGKDRERINSSSKYIVFPEGKDDKSDYR